MKMQKLGLKGKIFMLSLVTALNFFAFTETADNSLVRHQTYFSKNKKLKPFNEKEFYKFNMIIPHINKVAEERNVNPELLGMIVWLESNGCPRAERFEDIFYEKYIKQGELSDKLLGTYSMLKKQRKFNGNLEQFKKELSYSSGLGQVVYAIAIGYGHREARKSLFDINTNLRMVTNILKNNYLKTGANPYLVSTMYNTGRVNGEPAKGRNENLFHYLKILNR